MTSAPYSDHEPVLLSALLTPHRALSRAGFVAVMATVGLASFVAGFAFLLMGAWPVVGFFGLDVVLVYWAFRANFRAARAYEEITVTAHELHVRKVGPHGESAEWRFNPRWVRLAQTEDDEFGISRLFLMSHGRELTIAGFLGPDEKASFAEALRAALTAARHGPANAASV